MSRLIDLTGQHIGKWFVISKNGSKWFCRCVCGREAKVSAQSLRDGRSTGCIDCRPIKHGLCDHPLYSVWCDMKQRCTTPSYKYYHRYGGRGITVCPEWDDPAAFIEWGLTNGYRKGLTLDRRDNDAGYSPNNCRFVCRKTQSRNTASNRKMIDGILFTDYVNKVGVVSVSGAYARLRRGWSLEDAATIKPTPGKKT